MKYAALTHTELPVDRARLSARLAALREMPARLAEAVESSSPAELLRKPAPEVEAFSLHEHVHHLRDIEVLGYCVRIARILAEEHPELPDLDGLRLALERDYGNLPLAPALAEFTAARAANVARLRALPIAAFERRGELEGVGCIRLADLVELWSNHDADHAAEIAALA